MPPNRLSPATLAELMREVGIQPSGHSLYTDSIRRPIPHRDAYVPMRDVQLSQRQQQQSFDHLSQRQRIQSDIGRREAYDPGIDPNTGMTQAQEALLYNLEPTGVPSLFRSYNSFQEGRPLEGAGHGALGLLGTLGTASLASTPARQAATQTARLPRTGALSPAEEWTPAYRGLEQPFDGQFRGNPENWYGNTVSVSRSPESASFYARRTTGRDFGEGANVMPVEARGPFVPVAEFDAAVARNMRGRRWSREAEAAARQRATEEFRQRGFTGVESGVDGELAIFADPDGTASNVRSRFGDGALEPPTRLPVNPTRAPSLIDEWEGGYLHGTNRDFTDFDATVSPAPDRFGAFLTRRPEIASQYATGEGANVRPLEVRRGRFISHGEFNRMVDEHLAQNPVPVDQVPQARAELMRRLESEGYIGIGGNPLDETHVFNPARDTRPGFGSGSLAAPSRPQPAAPSWSEADELRIRDRTMALRRSGVRNSEARRMAEEEVSRAGAIEPPTRLPVNPTRDIAPNGLPIRPSEPFRTSLNGGSDDLLAAARSSAPQLRAPQMSNREIELRDFLSQQRRPMTDAEIARTWRGADGDERRVTILRGRLERRGQLPDFSAQGLNAFDRGVADDMFAARPAIEQTQSMARNMPRLGADGRVSTVRDGEIEDLTQQALNLRAAGRTEEADAYIRGLDRQYHADIVEEVRLRFDNGSPAPFISPDALGRVTGALENRAAFISDPRNVARERWGLTRPPSGDDLLSAARQRPGAGAGGGRPSWYPRDISDTTPPDVARRIVDGRAARDRISAINTADGPAVDANPNAQTRLTITPEGWVDLSFEGATIPGYRGAAPSSGADAVRGFGSGYRALVEDIEVNQRPVYRWRPSTTRLREFYRNAFNRRMPPGYRLIEDDRSMALVRDPSSGAEQMPPGPKPTDQKNQTPRKRGFSMPTRRR